MIFINQIGTIILIWLCLSGTLITKHPDDVTDSYLGFRDQIPNGKAGILEIESHSEELERLNKNFEAAMLEGNTVRSEFYMNLIQSKLDENVADTLASSESMYYIGVFCLLTGKNLDAIQYFRSSSMLREQISRFDELYAKCLYNMSIAYNNLGDFNRMEQYASKSHEIEKRIFGNSSPALIGGLSALITAYINLNDYTTAIDYGNTALKLVEGSDIKYNPTVAVLYTNIGTSHARLGDYSKAILFLEKAESIYRINFLGEDDNYINLLNNLGATYFFLGQHEKSDEYFKKGLSKIRTSNSTITLNFLNSFAIMLGNAGNIFRGETILANSLETAGNIFGKDSRAYYEVVKNYAEYLRIYNIDLEKSLRLYEQCLSYIERHEEDIALSNAVHFGYALALNMKGEPYRSLKIFQGLLLPGEQNGSVSLFVNPPLDKIRADQWSIKVLKAKHSVLWDIYYKMDNDSILIAALETSELIIRLLDKLRINISEDESRLLLGDRYRDSYLLSIRDIDFCFKKSGNLLYLNKAFEYSERSKVAGLLASTRELKATQFHIPPDIAQLERKLKAEIGFYNSKVMEESSSDSPDQSLMSEWKELIIKATQKRDSIIKVFENQYPDYYAIKYNTEVIDPDKVPLIAGKNINYLNYIISDTLLYIVLTNRKDTKLFKVPVDSTFFNDLTEFRNLLSLPHNDARSDFNRFIETGRSICAAIFDPVKNHLISNRLLISPDGILSYIPFEAIPLDNTAGDRRLFDGVSYLMDEYRISYTYSATLLSEIYNKNNNLSNRLIAFAPLYNEHINVDSLLKTRQTGKPATSDLPFARTEAEYVADLTGGKLYLNDMAREAVYKSEAGKYGIIHLAMHTILNDQYPMQSKMLFYQEKDSLEDGNLNTYEVYGIPLNAKMVMLSSCNTGSGRLYTGEGILSLARGFIYSGSQSVVMSMWEIEDRSGAEIVKSFYRYLKRGASKSSALRKARINYLKDADMLRSHPYFWSSLVIYGNDRPLYSNGRLISLLSVLIALIGGILLFLHHRPR